jgi:biopolymer transport protein ExbD
MRRRGWQRHVHHGQVELNVIPLIDVVFFLLVFYVISTSFIRESAVAIDRPQSSQSVAIQEGFVPVAVVKSGAIHIGPQVVDIAGLATEVSSALSQANATRVVVVADREVSTGLLLKVMDACQAGGAVNVDVAASRDGID